MQYLTDNGSWEFGVPAARNFERIHLAVDYCVDHKLDRVHVVIGMLDSTGRFDSSSKTIMHVPRKKTDPSQTGATGRNHLSPGASSARKQTNPPANAL